MNHSLNEIERVVREVLAELAVAQPPSAVQARLPQPAAPQPGTAAPQAGTDRTELIVGGRVVTRADVDGRLDGVRRVTVAPDAIVTPAVRDELLRRNIDLARTENKNSQPAGAARLFLVTVGRRFDPAPLAAALAKEAIEVDVYATECLIDATDRAAAELAGGATLAAILTRHTAAALCLANRHSGVRAVWACEAMRAAQAIVAVGANLLIIDPEFGGFFQLKQTLAEFCRGGARRCPEALRERLS